MRFVPKAISVTIGAIALYFALAWGFEASRILTSPVYGLDNVAFAQTVYGLGSIFSLSQNGLLLVATFFGATKLLVSTLFICQFLDRAAAPWGRKADHETLYVALLLIVVSTIVEAMPVLPEAAPGALRIHALDLLLAGVAVILSVGERTAERNRVAQIENAALEAVAEAIIPFEPGHSVTTEDWDLSRKAASSAAA